MTADREKDLLALTDILLDARRTGEKLTALPEGLTPTSLDEVYFVQDAIAEAFGEIGGWKIGAPTADATPIFAPMPMEWTGPDNSVLQGGRILFRGLEAEIAFLVGEDLPPRKTPYTLDEVVAVLASCHPVIEELETAFVDPAAVDKFAMMADLQMHGAFVYGPAYADWKSVDFTKEKVTLSVDGIVRVERVGSNTSGNLMRLLPYLANEGAARTGGLKRGQWITTGSWTGNTLASNKSTVDVEFSTVGSVHLRFA